MLKIPLSYFELRVTGLATVPGVNRSSVFHRPKSQTEKHTN